MLAFYPYVDEEKCHGADASRKGRKGVSLFQAIHAMYEALLYERAYCVITAGLGYG
jgi:hypothetical protein